MLFVFQAYVVLSVVDRHFHIYITLHKKLYKISIPLEYLFMLCHSLEVVFDRFKLLSNGLRVFEAPDGGEEVLDLAFTVRHFLVHDGAPVRVGSLSAGRPQGVDSEWIIL